MNKRHYEHTLPNIRGSLSNTYNFSEKKALAFLYKLEKATTELAVLNRQVIDLTNECRELWLPK